MKFYRYTVDSDDKQLLKHESYNEQDFSWGVLALNTDKDSYNLGQEAIIDIAILDNEGEMVCNAEVELAIEHESGYLVELLSVENGGIKVGKDCNYKRYTELPDYLAKFTPKQEGRFILNLTANTKNGSKNITRTLNVSNDQIFDITHNQNTRIYPQSHYPVKISILPRNNFEGQIIQRIPSEFSLIDRDESIVKLPSNIVEIDNEKILTWDVSLSKGVGTNIGYTFDAPDVHPAFYTFGELFFYDSTGTLIYKENNPWQLAIDNLDNRYATTCTTTWTNSTNATGSPTLGSTAVYSSFTSSNSATAIVGANDTMDCSGFSNTDLGTFVSAKVWFSMAADGTGGDNDNTVVQYDVNGGGYSTLVTYTHNTQRSNATNTDYWVYTAPNITSWTDVGNTTVRFDNNKSKGSDGNPIFVDSVWVEVDYTPPPVGIDISGSCKDFDRVTNCPDSQTVRVAVNGTLDAATTTTSGGSWTLSNVSVSGGDDVIVYLQSVADANEAVAVTNYDGTGNITGMLLYEEHLTIGSDDNATVTNSDISNYDYSSSGNNEDIFVDVDANNDLDVDINGQSSQEMLYIISGNTFQPDLLDSGNVTTHDIEIDGTLDADGNTYYIGGSWVNNSVFSSDTSTVIFDTTSGTESIDSGGAAFNNLTIGQTSGTAEWDLSSSLDINGNLLIDYGTLDMNGSNTINLAGNLTINANGSYTKGSGAFTLDGTGTNTWTDNNTTKEDMGDITIDGPKTIDLGTSVTATSVDVTTGDTINLGSSGYNLTLTGSGAGASRPFIVSGTLNEGTNSTVTYAGTSAAEVEAETYYNLDITAGGAGSPTHVLGTATSQTITISNNFTIGEGTNTVTASTTSYSPTINITNNVDVQANGTLGGSGTGTITTNNITTGAGSFNLTNGTFEQRNTSGGATFGSSSGSNDWTFYNLRISYSGSAPATTTLASGGTGSIIVTNLFEVSAIGDANKLTIDNDTNDRILDIDKDFTINTGIFSSSSTASFTIGQNFTNNGTFTANTGTVTFDDASQTSQLTYSGNTSFYNMTVNTPGKAMQFDETDQTDITGTWTLNGTDCTTGRIFLDSTVNDNQWDVDASGTVSIDNVDVEDSNAITALTANNSTEDNNNNTNWTVSPGTCATPIAPTVTSVSVNGGLNITLTEGTTTTVNWTSTVTDANGFGNISAVTGKLYRSGVTNAEACTIDDNSCYEDASCPLSGCAGTSCTATCSVDLQFHADPTDATSIFSTEYWLGWVEATDADTLTGEGFSSAGVNEVSSLFALDIAGPITHGSLFAGDDTGPVNQTTLVTNQGNRAIDLEVSGNDMCDDYPTCAGSTIAVTYQEYSTGTFTYGAGTTLTGTAAAVDASIAKSTVAPSTATSNLYWGLGLPSVLETGLYNGANDVVATDDI